MHSQALNKSRNIRASVTRFLVASVILTCSFDIFLTLEVAGATIRYCQIAEMCLACIALGGKGHYRGILRDKSFIALLVFVCLNTVFVFRSESLTNAIGYEGWLLINVIFLVAVYGLTERGDVSVSFLARWYLVGSSIVALFGLLQFALSHVGVYLFVTQFGQTGFGRINGFSFEPSYYSTYLIAAWVTLAYLAEKGSFIVLSRRMGYGCLLVLTLSILLSTSKLGWGAMALWVVLRVIMALKSALCGRSFGSNISVRRAVPLVAIVIVIVCIVGLIGQKYDLINTFFAGSGLFGTSAHSSGDRLSRMGSLLALFVQSPLLGVSLGGVDPALATYLDIPYSTNGLGINTTLEVAVATGVFGALAWLYFVLTTCLFRPFVSKRDACSLLTKGLAAGVAIQFLLLQANQNMLRPYFWVGISILFAALQKGGMASRRADPHLMGGERADNSSGQAL